MAYIEVRTTLPDHRKAKAMARELGLRRPWVIGHLVCLWAWALDNVPRSGSLAGLTPADLEEAAQWPEDRAGELEPAMTRHGFIDVERRERFLHDWDDYTGRLLKRREEDRARKRSERAATRANGTISDPKTAPKRPKSKNASGGRPADAGPMSSGQPPMSVGKGAKSATPRAPARAPAPRRTAPHRTAPTVERVETEEVPPARATRTRRSAAEPLSFDPQARPDLAALTDRGWRVSAAQADDLAEIANNERPTERDVLGGFQVIAGWLADAPKKGDLHRWILDRANRLKAERAARADAAEADWAETKAGSAGLIAAELVARMAGTNGAASRISREAAIEQLRAMRGQVPEPTWSQMLERYDVTAEDLEDPEDPVDFTAPLKPEEAPHA